MRVEAPATEKVPPTAVLPVPDATVNAVVATLKSPVDPRAPATATDALLGVAISVSLPMPMAFEVKRTDSTSTYPAVLVIATPPLDAVCKSCGGLRQLHVVGHSQRATDCHGVVGQGDEVRVVGRPDLGICEAH